MPEPTGMGQRDPELELKPEEVGDKTKEFELKIEAMRKGIDQILPGINIEGLKKEDGIYISKDIYPQDTKSADNAFSAHVLKEIFDGSAEDVEARLKELKHYLRGRTVVDIGAGNSLLGYALACYAESSGYIAVEPSNFERLNHGSASEIADKRYLNYLDKELLSKSLIPYSIVAEDMRPFLKRLPDESVCFFVIGIDGDIIGDMPKKDFIEAKKNIDRAMCSGGVELHSESVLEGENLSLVDTYDRSPEKKGRPRTGEIPYYLSEKKP